MKLIENGKRMDGRRPDEIRKVTIEAGVLHRADGSCYLEWGGNKVLAAVYGPREAIPRHSQDPTKAVVKCRYNMAAFSVDDRKRPGPDRRSQEISKVISEAFENVIITGNRYSIILVCGFGGVLRLPIHDSTNIETPINSGRM